MLTITIKPKIYLEKVISGMQIGADYAGVYAAKELGFEVGGWMPLGFKTQKGKRPEYANIFNAKTTMTNNYSNRTEYNVRDSSGTIRIANDFLSAGEICTLNAIKKHKKPYLDIWYPLGVSNPFLYHDPRLIWHWIETYNITTLNVAGNANETMEGSIIEFLTRVFKRYINDEKKSTN